jgi:hypothetical protein
MLQVFVSTRVHILLISVETVHVGTPFFVGGIYYLWLLLLDLYLKSLHLNHCSLMHCEQSEALGS